MIALCSATLAPFHPERVHLEAQTAIKNTSSSSHASPASLPLPCLTPVHAHAQAHELSPPRERCQHMYRGIPRCWATPLRYICSEFGALAIDDMYMYDGTQMQMQMHGMPQNKAAMHMHATRARSCQARSQVTSGLGDEPR